MLKTAIASLCAVAALSLAAAEENSKQNIILAKGVFGEALNGFGAPAHSARNLPAYKAFPLTVEFWCKLNSREGFNILVANEPKVSASHWELYSESNTGTLSAYLCGLAPSIIKTEKNITDGQWHYVAAVFETHSTPFMWTANRK